LLLTLTLIAIFSAIDQLGISEMGRIARGFKEIKCRSFVLSYLFIMLSTLTF
ncbi:two-component system connector SafA, partial [Escherichia coli]|uniref:two-component system connector SafA n=1 Tax=Escherichia coli TaxID=562 RepID=UPI00207CC656